MFPWLRRFWRARDEFHLDAVGRRMRPANVRRYAHTDYDACVDLYRLNEPGRFPPGVLPEFETSLKGDASLFLVIEEGALVVGCGGIHIRSSAEWKIAFLSFGLIHPSKHRQGFGTILLLARLALVAPDVSLAALLPVENSQSFYERFGFRYRCKLKTTTGEEMAAFGAQLSPDSLEYCRTRLRRAGVRLPADEISLPEIADPPP